MWNKSKLSVMEVLKRGYSISIKCSTINRKICWISNNYGPTHTRQKPNLARVVSSFKPLYRSLVFGRGFQHYSKVQERFPVGRLTRGMRKFNKFIRESKLLEILLSNGKFTWSREGRSVSRSLLDRFLVTDDQDESFADTRASQKERLASDHFPILLEAGAFAWPLSISLL